MKKTLPSTQTGLPNFPITEDGTNLPSSWEMEFIHSSLITPATRENIDRLDHLAFAGKTDEGINEWADSDWMVLGRVDGEIVAQLGLLKREIRVGRAPITVGGVGGVATLPVWQRRGLGTALMGAAAKFLQTEIKVSFGLLVCADETQPFYSRLGWKTVATELWVTQGEISLPLETVVMVLPLADQEWPQGKIDLCGPSW